MRASPSGSAGRPADGPAGREPGNEQGRRGWWSGHVRRAWRYVRASVKGSELAQLTSWVPLEQRRLFDSMPVADRRHCLDTVAWLAGHDVQDRDLLLAALLHDCGKGHEVGFFHRVAWSLGQRYGDRVLRLARRLPGFDEGLARLRDHAERSAELAEEAGATYRTIDLIRNQEHPRDEAGRQLAQADEAS